MEITKRKPASPQGSKSNQLGFYLLKRRFILVQEALKNFAGSGNPVGRQMPLKKVRLTSLRSPDLQAPTQAESNVDGICFWPVEINTGQEVNWGITADDEHGQKINSQYARLLFASNIVVGHRTYQQATVAQRTMQFDGSKIAFARETPTIHVDAPPGANNLQPVLFEVPQGPARFLTQLAIALRSQLPNRFKDLSAVEDVIRTVPKGDVPATAAEVENVLQQVKDAVATIGRWGQKAPQGLAELHEQLERAEKTAASMATNAITFGSRVVDRVVTALAKNAATLERNLHDAKNATQLAAAAADIFKTVLEGEGDNLKDGNLAGDLGSWFKQLQDQADGLAGTLTERADKLEFVRGKLLGLHSELSNLQSELASKASQYFHTVMERADVLIPALKDVLPAAPVRSIEMFAPYVAGGAAGVRQGIYANLVDVINTGQELAKGVKNGIAQPAAMIAGLSREIGAVVGEGKAKLEELSKQFKGFDLSSAIPDAKLFGVISLKTLLGELLPGELPKIQTVELPDRIERSWEWIASLDHEKAFGPLTVTFPDNAHSRLAIFSRATLYLPTKQQIAEGSVQPTPDLEVQGWLGKWDETGKDFEHQKLKVKDSKDPRVQLELLHLIRVSFGYVEFQAHYGQADPAGPEAKTPQLKLDPKFLAVDFLGPLAFVAKLQEFLKGLGDTFHVDLQPSYLAVASTIELPPVSFGLFSLRSLRVEQSLELPFGGTPLKFKFSFASFEKPFELSVMGFAGRGYFAAALWSDGKRELEGALEFGGSLSFDVVVASGGLHVMAGAYFKISNSETTLSGYLRAGGNLDVLGLIHASVEFLLTLNWHETPGGSELYGSCTVTVSIDLGLFSMDVSITMEKSIAGSAQTRAQNGDHAYLSGGPLFASNAMLVADLFETAAHKKKKKKPSGQRPKPISSVPPPSSTSNGTANHDKQYSYIARETTAAGQFASVEKWQDTYWKYFALNTSDHKK